MPKKVNTPPKTAAPTVGQLIKAAKKQPPIVDKVVKEMAEKAFAVRNAALMDARMFAAQLNGVLTDKVRGGIEALVVFAYYSGRTGTFDYRLLLGLAQANMQKGKDGETPAPVDNPPVK